MNVLFICSRNRWRSPTAARIYARDARLSVRSAGLSESSPHRLTQGDLAWADRVLVMEQEHRSRLRSRFRGRIDLPPIYVLDVPDEYEFMDPELVALLRAAIEEVLAR